MTPTTLGFGALQDILDPRDLKFADLIAGAPEIPKTFSLRDKQSPVKDQGRRGTCTAFAGAGILEYFEFIEDPEGGFEDLSEEYLFRRAKEIDVADYNYEGYGAYLRSAAKAMTKYGACQESALPYNKGGSETYWKDVTLDSLMDMLATYYQMKAYAAIEPHINLIQLALLTTNAPVLTGITLHENYTKARTNGILPLPEGNIVAGHALGIVGWNLMGWIMKNSWGGLWGDNGYLIVPFNYRLYQSWSFIDADNRFLTDKGRLAVQLAKCAPWAREAFHKAQEKGIANESTDPKAILTKEELMVFFERAGLL